MIPCGFMHEVASIERLGVRTEMRTIVERVAIALSRSLDRTLTWSPPEPATEHEIALDAPVRSAEDLVTAIAA